MITITLQPVTPEQLDAALALLQRIRDEKAKSDAEFAKTFYPTREDLNLALAAVAPQPTDEREPGCDDEPTPAPVEVEQPKAVRRTRKTPPVDEPQPVVEPPVAVEPEPAPPAPAAPTYTLEQVRSRLAEITQAGKKDEIRALLVKHGAARLTELDPAIYPALMADAEAL